MHKPTPWSPKILILRFAIVLCTVAVAIGIPHFSLFLSLIGGLGCSLLAFILPTAFHLKVFWKQTSLFIKGIHMAIFVFGVVSSIITTGVTVYQIATL